MIQSRAATARVAQLGFVMRENNMENWRVEAEDEMLLTRIM